jgi:hypothetical protein
MDNDKVNITESIDAMIIKGVNKMNDQENDRVHGVYTAKCFGADGNLKWEETFDNIITDVGANFLLTQAFGTAINSTYFLGLTAATPTCVVGSTMVTKAGWTEATGWSTPAANARQPVTWGAASARARAITAVSFTASGAVTVGGCFIVTSAGAVATNGDTNGTLYSVGAFSSNKSLVLNDTLQVSYSTSLGA